MELFRQLAALRWFRPLPLSRYAAWHRSCLHPFRCRAVSGGEVRYAGRKGERQRTEQALPLPPPKAAKACLPPPENRLARGLL